MPRQDVPYGGAICRLKERIAEIWDKLDQKLHSINGVEGDGVGNVDIVSGNAAVVINNDQVGHRIEVSLDGSKLPAAAVSSVNGQTGAVRLDAVNILSDGDSNVQADIAANKAAINDCFDSITSEQTARQNADAALQGNINSVQASIPGAAAAAVSKDPTVAQLAEDVPNKLDKITSGSALKAYTHTGQSQGETAVVNGVGANSIGLRDANGRMQAADPAAGATDKTLVTANWVSQTGDGAPNNLIHKTGNETKKGIFKANGFIINGNNGTVVKSNLDLDSPPNVQKQVQLLKVEEADSAANVMFLQLIDDTDGVRYVRLNVYSSNGTRVILPLMTVNADGTTTYPWS